MTTEERDIAGTVSLGSVGPTYDTTPNSAVPTIELRGPKVVARGRAALLAAVVVLLVIVGVLAGMLLRGSAGSSPAPAVAAASGPAVSLAPISAADGADRAVCVDLDARGGSLYEVFVVPMLAGSEGRKSVNVDVARMQRATAAVAQLDSTDLAQASPSIANEGGRLVASARAMDFYAHVDGTALLTSFVGLSAECQKAGHKPSWFDANALLAN